MKNYILETPIVFELYSKSDLRVIRLKRHLCCIPLPHIFAETLQHMWSQDQTKFLTNANDITLALLQKMKSPQEVQAAIAEQGVAERIRIEDTPIIRPQRVDDFKKDGTFDFLRDYIQ